MYEILLEGRAERDLKKLPKGMFDRVVLEIKSLAQNPKPHGVRKIVGSKNDWRIRIGDYRVIYEVDEELRAVKVMRIRHHSLFQFRLPWPAVVSCRSPEPADRAKPEVAAQHSSNEAGFHYSFPASVFCLLHSVF